MRTVQSQEPEEFIRQDKSRAKTVNVSKKGNTNTVSQTQRVMPSPRQPLGGNSLPPQKNGKNQYEGVIEQSLRAMGDDSVKNSNMSSFSNRAKVDKENDDLEKHQYEIEIKDAPDLLHKKSENIPK